MRISDWSSDVCSSDLLLREQLGQERRLGARQEDLRSADLLAHVEDDGAHPVVAPVMLARQHLVLAQHRLGAAQVDDDVAELVALDQTVDDLADPVLVLAELAEPLRSEEHTSELQSLMRISYAVFCLKKKKNKTT